MCESKGGFFMVFKEKLRTLRKQCGLTQKQLSDALGLERSAYSYYETGKSVPPIDKMITLSKIFNVTLDELMCANRRENIVRDDTSVYNTAHLTPLATLPKDEQELLVLYRSMSESMCADVLKYMRKLLEKNQD